MKEELVFAILVFGFRLLPTSLLFDPASIVLPSPNAGAEPTDNASLALPVADVPSSLGASAELLLSFGCSCILDWSADAVLLFVSTRNRSGGAARELKESKDTLVPAVAGCGVVARGFGFIIGASDG